MCGCDIGYTCPSCADDDAKREWSPWDVRDYLDAISGASTPWHDLDSEGFCGASCGPLAAEGASGA